jgi:short-subunit dehydrogenase
LCFLPAVRAARGKILNVASIAAYFPGGPGMATNYASKSFVLSFSLALSQELHSQGVTVSALCPGYTKTDFQARAGFGPNMDLSRLPGSTAIEVAEAGYAGLIAGRREIVPGFLNKFSISLLPFLPKALILAVISRLQQNRAPHHPETGLTQEGGETRRVSVITGASGGIGAGLARVFARHGHDLALVDCSRAELEALADEIAASGRPRPLVLVFDLIEQGAVTRIAAALEAAEASPEILVNNAGFGLVGEAAGLDPTEQLAIIDLNIRVVVEITLCFLPSIRAARGKILNVASISAYFPGGPGMAAYYASKSFVLSFSLALSQELNSQGVTVSALCPGLTKTGFQARAGFGPNIGLARLPTSTAIEVAEAGYAGLIGGRREIVPGFLNKVGILLLPSLPKALILAVISRLRQNGAPHR